MEGSEIQKMCEHGIKEHNAKQRIRRDGFHVFRPLSPTTASGLKSEEFRKGEQTVFSASPPYRHHTKMTTYFVFFVSFFFF